MRDYGDEALHTCLSFFYLSLGIGIMGMGHA